MTDVTHESIFFSGHVQGVGFRYTTLQVAKEFEVTGFVTNLADGRVQVEIEGTASEIEAFLDALQDRVHGYVRKTEQSRSTGPRQYSGFTIH